MEKRRHEGGQPENLLYCEIQACKATARSSPEKEGARRSKERMTEKCGAKIRDEEKQQGRQDGRKSPVLSLLGPPLPPQPLPLWEQIEEMYKRNQELADRMHAQGGAGGEERPEGQGNWEPPAPPPPQSLSLLEQLEQVWESAKCSSILFC